jgi:hypothetical protein
MSQPAPITRAGAQRAARHDLTKSIYHRNAEPWPVRLVRAAGRLVDHALNKALSAAPNGAGGGIALVLVIAVVAIVVFWRVGPPRRVAKVGAVLPAGQSVSAAEHRSLAEAATGRGDLHTAVIETMRAVACELEERSVLPPRPGRTATELAHEAGHAVPTVSGELSRAAATFNDVAYGGAEATRAALETMSAADDAVRRSSRSRVLAR